MPQEHQIRMRSDARDKLIQSSKVGKKESEYKEKGKNSIIINNRSKW